MDTLKWLLPILLVWPAIKLVQLLSVVRVVRGVRFGVEAVDRIDDANIPVWFQEASAPLADQLVALGFSRRFVCVRRSCLGSVFDAFTLVLVHPEGPVAASVRIHASAARDGAAFLQLLTPLATGRDLVTSNHVEVPIVPLPSGQDLEIVSACSTAEQLARHRARLEAAAAEGAPALDWDEDEAWLAHDRAEAVAAYERLRESGLVEPIPGPAPFAEAPASPILMLRWSAAFAAARRSIRAAQTEVKAARVAASANTAVNAPATKPLSDETRTQLELRHYRQIQALQDLRFSWLPKALLMVGTLVLFALALRWTLSPGLGLVLIAALAFHEGGHLLGMRLFGYKDTQLLFLPFLGGIAVARDRLVLAPWKHLVILFLGPLPGILVGAALLLWPVSPASTEFVREAGYLLLIFNAFNLLPILPLDGGQIMDVALVSRFPRLRVIFLVLSALGLVAVGFLSSSVLLKFLGVFMLFRLPTEWKQAGIVKKLRRELPPRPTEETVLARLLPELRHAFAPALGTPQRLQLVRPLEERIRRPRPGWGTVGVAISGYLLPLVLGLGLAVLIQSQRGERLVTEARARAAAAGLSEPAVPAYAAVGAPDNAALPLLELEQLFAEQFTPSLVEPEYRERAFALIADAASRPGFALPADKITRDPETGGFQGLRVAFELLVEETESRQRYGKSDEALALAVQGLTALKHVRRAPHLWAYETDQAARRGLWRVVEEVLSQGAPTTEAQLRQLASAAEETPFLDYARQSLREARIEGARWIGVTDSGEEMPVVYRVLIYLSSRLQPDFHSGRAGYYDDTIALDSALRRILATNTWPEKSGQADSFATWSTVDWELDRLGNDVAALRVISSGIALKRIADQKAPLPETPAQLQAPWPLPPPRHPRSDDEIGLAPRGAYLVLSLPRVGEPSFDEDTAETEFTWRVRPSK